PNHQLANCPLLYAEGLSAAAGRRRVRVLDREAAAGDRVDEVDFRAVQVPDADRVDEKLHPVRLEDLIARTLAVFLDHQAVLEARAAAALDEHPQPAPALVFFGQQLVDLRGGHFRDINHALIIARPDCYTALPADALRADFPGFPPKTDRFCREAMAGDRRGAARPGAR